MRINTNVLNAQNKFAKLTKVQNATYKHLSESKRIYPYYDETRGIEVKSNNQAAQNAKDTTDIMQVADATIGQVYDKTGRARPDLHTSFDDERREPLVNMDF
ncbi:MAG: hypothetical protein HEEMFOPI_01756 [Holosporales bacterium]